MILNCPTSVCNNTDPNKLWINVQMLAEYKHAAYISEYKSK